MFNDINLYSYFYKFLLFGSISSMMLALTLMPLMFNFSIIPGIEKKIGKKLEFNSWIYQYEQTGKYLRCSEIAFYIVKCYIANIINKPITTPKTKTNAALNPSIYPVEKFSRREIVWSFLFEFMGVFFFVGGGILFFLPKP